MNKLKNIGITALAGALVSLSAAQAGGVSVTGSYELSYTKLDNDEVAGNKLGMNKNITFGASGDLSDGGAITWASTVVASDSIGLSSASININMGGIATLTYDSGTGGTGANSVDNIVPTAWEEIDAGFSTGITDVGRVSKSKGVVNLTIKAPGSGSAISLSTVGRMGGTHVADGATGADTSSGGRGLDGYIDFVNVSYPYFALRMGTAAEIEFVKETCQDMKMDRGGPSEIYSCPAAYNDNPWAGSAYISGKLGPLSGGFQATYKDTEETAATAVAYNNAWVAGVALTMGSNFSVSYGRGTDVYTYNNAERDGTGEDEHVHFEGYSAALNLGPAALKYFKNEVDSLGGTGKGDAQSEINLSLAF